MQTKPPHVELDILDPLRQLETLRRFVDFVAETQYSRPLQVYACHLRSAIIDPSGLSELSVLEVATMLGAPEVSIKRAHRRLSHDGWIERSQVSGRASATAPHVMGGDEDGSIECALRLQEPEPVGSAQPPEAQVANKWIANLYGALSGPSDSDGTAPAVSSIGPFDLPASPQQGSKHVAETKPPPSGRGNARRLNASSSRRVLTDTEIGNIQRMVKDAAYDTQITADYPDMDRLVCEVAWSVSRGVYRDHSVAEALRICLSTIRRGKWRQPIAYSHSEGNAIMCTR